MDVVEIDGLSGGELLDHAEDLATTRNRLEVEIFRVAVRHAYVHNKDTLDLCHRLPPLWARVEAGRVRVYLARLVARKTRDLTPEQAAYVDSRVTPYADGRLTWTRFQALVEGVVAAADPDATAEREHKAAEQQLARRACQIPCVRA